MAQFTLTDSNIKVNNGKLSIISPELVTPTTTTVAPTTTTTTAVAQGGVGSMEIGANFIVL